MPTDPQTTVFETSRLLAVLPEPADAWVFHRLWTDPRVMTNVGFPNGLQITAEEIAAQIAAAGPGPLNRYLLVVIKSSGEPAGECKLIPPDEQGIARTDIKLLPEYWGNRYGVEIKRGLLDYLFTHTDCKAVEATPNVQNQASIKMQQAVGGVCVSSGVFEVPEHLQDYAQPVPHYVFLVQRETWLARKQAEAE